jgi:hypothetical protein
VVVVKRRQPVLGSLTSTVVHEGLNSLLVAATHLHLVQWRIDHLSVDALELAVAAEVDLDVGVF